MDSLLTPLRAPRSLPQLMQEIRAWERSVPRPPEPAEPAEHADVADDSALTGVPALPAWAAQGGC